MNIFISGGSKNGKSSFGQDIAVRLSKKGKLYYVATMIPYDDEDRVRIARHIENRSGMGFETIEVGRNISSIFERADEAGTFLVDSTTALLLNEMFPESYEAEADPTAVTRCIEGLLEVANRAGNAVFVSDYIYSDAARYDSFTESYRRSLASIDRVLAQKCDVVIEASVGNRIIHKGKTIYEKMF
ncbi:MAG: bifunctional adenosylcobinamide kinase/adenosylcobinamide-phosphate guanylyltransferase [Oscillospiraceae bacterium]|nr:bifunctional adenosylcobinamide kinase/adenosylcobinamide-phosphate guanylyltransferase [Oscillospiraceae bacterium]